MQLLASKISGFLERASWIRKMFEKGAELKQQYGPENVYDFSLGNPDLPPPPKVGQGLLDLAGKADQAFVLGYMPNNGYPSARAALAKYLTQEQGVSVGDGDLVITCGAAGALNAFLRAVIEPGEEVITPAPFFVEYGFYCDNHGGVLVPVKSRGEDFSLDIAGIEAAITDKTRAVLINSPHNPTGKIYSEAEIKALAEVLVKKSGERPIFLISDEPYRFLTFDGAKVPSILPLYPYSLVVSSFSKNLSLAGERVGYALVNPGMPGRQKLLEGMVFANRTLGFVNAPAVGQRLMEAALGSQVDVGVYESRRAAMAEVLSAAGYEFFMPQGAFYFFPKAPGGDDVAFVNRLQEQRVLAVPGTGFGFPGYFRLAFCVDEKIIRASAEGFKKAMGR